MRIKYFALIVALLLGVVPACAQTGTNQTAAQLNTEINSKFPDQNVGAITPFIFRQLTLDMVASSVGTTITALTGDVTATGPGSAAATLASVNGNVGTFGSVTVCSTITVNAKGLITAINSATCTPSIIAVTGLGTGVATALGVSVGTAGAPIVNGGALGTPSSGTLTSVSGLPIAGVTGWGTGVATALGINVGTAGAPVVNGGALGTPSGGTLTSATGLPAAGVVGTAATLGAAQSFTKAQRGTPVNVGISTATFTPSFDNSQNFEIDLTSACPCTLANPSTSLVAGQSGVIEVHQDGSGSRTIGTWGTNYLYVGGTSTITLSTTASAVDYFSYYVNNAATGVVLGALLKAPAH
jgi:hypothetical protein